ncbi:hypothetical protein [Staphylococcus simulans]|uniref:hypothetical protein n=1 Tax=Staphylococcus simulans TaxID=1286 RepID=UPI000D029B91|nr:hypothetical protein [Staphylococcus simulans]
MQHYAIRHPVAKRIADIITIVSFIAMIALIAFNFYFHSHADGFSAGFHLNSTAQISWLIALLIISIASDIVSTILKRQKLETM